MCDGNDVMLNVQCVTVLGGEERDNRENYPSIFSQQHRGTVPAPGSVQNTLSPEKNADSLTHSLTLLFFF